MQLSHSLLLVGIWLLLLPCTSFVLGGVGANLNLTDFLQHRQRRSLIFEGSGGLKFVIGPILPVDLGDPITFRSVICYYNLQGGQYSLPTTPLYPWDKWEDTFARSLQRVREEFDRSGAYREDDSRLFVYTALENYMDRQGVAGRQCLLRAICENAQVDQHVGMLAELLDILLTPGKESLDPVYGAARVAGRAGADCNRLYASCPPGASVLDSYLDEL